MKKAKIVALLVLIVFLISTLTYTVYAVLTASITLSNRITFVTTDANYIAVCEIYYEGYEDDILLTRTLNKSGTIDDDLINSIEISNPFNITSTKNVLIYKITVQNYSDYEVSVAINFPEVPLQYSEKITQESSAPVTINSKINTTIESDFVTLKTTFLKSSTSFLFDNSFTVNISPID